MTAEAESSRGHDASLKTPLFWLLVIAVLSGAIVLPPGGLAAGWRGWVHGGGVLLLSLGLTLVLCTFVLAQGASHRRFRRRALPHQPDALLEKMPFWPGFRASAGGVGLLLIFLSCYNLAAPVEVSPGGYRLAALLMTLVTASAGAALFTLVARRWNLDLAEAAMGLTTMAPCCTAMALLPAAPARLDYRFPLIFNAAIVALAAMTALWTWLSRFWHQQLDDGRPWTTAGRLVDPSARFAFLTGAIALLVSILLAVWPRIPTVSASDDSLPRFAAGISGYLILLLALIGSARRTGNGSFNVLSAATVVAMLGFIVVRVMPYSSAQR